MTTKTQTHIAQLETYAKQFLKDEFGLNLDVLIKISNRMSKTLGYFQTGTNRTTGQTRPLNITISGNLIKHYTQEEVLDTLKHECVHYALYMLGKPYRDGQAYFENTLKRLGIGSTRTIEFKGIVHNYTCTSCNEKFQRKRRFNTSKYRCGRCKEAQTLKYVSQSVVK